MERVVIVVLLGIVVFLLWERFHYRQRISDLYDTVVELAAGLDPRFELRSHPALRRYFVIDAILDDMESKLGLLSDERGGTSGARRGSDARYEADG
jgi:hypothetical protein